MNPITLYPRLVPNVALEFLDKQDLEVLERLSQAERPHDNGTIETVMIAKACRVGKNGFLIEDTGCDFAKTFRKMILAKWKEVGASEELISVIRAAQRQNCKLVIFSDDGMIPEPRRPAKLEKLGKHPLKKKTVRSLLESLSLMHRDLWPIEQLANVLNPALKESRRRR